MALGSELISRITGYSLTGADFSETSPNLPIRIALLGEANTANQGTLETTPQRITSAQQAGELYGFGSPIHAMARILFPVNGGGFIGGIPVDVLAQEEPVGAAEKILTITASGVATGNGTHTLYLAGRTGIDGQFYDINVQTGDTAADIADKIETAVNNVLGAPVTAAAAVYDCVLTSKWKGLTADELTVEVLTNGNALGLTYSVANTQSGSGTPSIQGALDQFDNIWYNLVINGYGLQTSTLTLLENFNGKPGANATTPGTGRYAASVFKPFVALSGSTADDPTTVTDARLNEVTVAVCPAPLSKGLTYEAAANFCALAARTAQDNPHLDIGGSSLPDMPTPRDGNIGSMKSYTNRDAFVKEGCSTVQLVDGAYQVEDFVTTYHPTGELPPQYRYVRNLLLDYNVRYTYLLLELQNVVGYVIANDNDTVSAPRVTKPKIWKGVLFGMFDDLVNRGLIVDAAFARTNLTVQISSTNPDRFETQFKYKRSGVARISDTIATAGFNFGN